MAAVGSLRTHNKVLTKMKQLNKSTVETVDRPVRILQFGEGNFLRAFVDWQIDIANEKGVMNSGVAICQPIWIPSTRCSA